MIRRIASRGLSSSLIVFVVSPGKTRANSTPQDNDQKHFLGSVPPYSTFTFLKISYPLLLLPSSLTAPLLIINLKLKPMKQIFAPLSAVILLAIISCNSNETAKEETTTTATNTDTSSTVKAPEPPAFKPFTVTLIQHKVKNFDKWLPVYKADDSARKANGLTEETLGRGLDNNNEVLIALVSNDIQKAKDFAGSPALKETMKKAGVTGTPVISYVNVIRDDSSHVDQKDRLLISHHVKDFDAWLKVYDGESKDARAGFGLKDRGIGRGVDDPNKVYVLLVVTDLAKAKARVASPELKKLMADAGVDEPAKVTFFKVVE
jgi:hypothetical protein